MAMVETSDPLDGLARPHRTLLVGIDGLGGSGKSTFAECLARWPAVQLVPMDDFYRPAAEQVSSSIGSAFDLARLRGQVLEPLLVDRPGRYQRYDWSSDALAEWIDVPVGGLVVVEGVYSTSAYLRDAYDFRAWVACPADVRLERGVRRDGEVARNRWLREWMPVEERYAAEGQPAAWADLVVDGTRPLSPDRRIFTRQVPNRHDGKFDVSSLHLLYVSIGPNNLIADSQNPDLEDVDRPAGTVTHKLHVGREAVSNTISMARPGTRGRSVPG